jgi:S1-C subfamily serine protease
VQWIIIRLINKRNSSSVEQGDVIPLGLPQAIEQIRPSIVQFCFMATELSEKLRQQVGAPFLKKVIGTGFFVNDEGYVITARHVLQGGMQIVSRIDAGKKTCWLD